MTCPVKSQDVGYVAMLKAVRNLPRHGTRSEIGPEDRMLEIRFEYEENEDVDPANGRPRPEALIKCL
eukprot:5706036-Prymnesium_polylepis.1